MKGTIKAERMRRAVLLSALILCVGPAVMPGQRPAERRAAPAGRRFEGQRVGQGAGMRQQPRQNGQFQRPNQGQYRAAPAARPNPNSERPYANPPVARPAYPNGGAQGGAYPGMQGNRPAPVFQAQRPAPVRPNMGPPGHLGDWLSQHRNLPPQDQERLLRNSPSFNRLPPQTQQRLTQQLHQLNQMPEEQRERRLARSEMLERLSPQEQMQVRAANQQFSGLPPGRQSMVKQAFQDLRTVPQDQRQTVLNSARYQSNFSPQEREILNNFLKVEP